MAEEEDVSIPVESKVIEAVITRPKALSSWSKYGIVLTHGAGGDLRSPFLVHLKNVLSQYGFIILRFTCKPPNFQYRVKCYKAVVDYFKASTNLTGCILAGRSMGARVAAEIGTRFHSLDGFVFGIGCFSYPLHKPLQFRELRALHLQNLRLPVFIVNGTKDSMCKQELMNTLVESMSCDVTVHWIKEADHSLAIKNSKSSSMEISDNICRYFVDWCQCVFSLEKTCIH